MDVTTAVYPGFATDMQAQWIALMTRAEGASFVTDEVYPDRYIHFPPGFATPVAVSAASAYDRWCFAVSCGVAKRTG